MSPSVKQKIRQRFSKLNYLSDNATILPKEIINRMLERLDYIKFEPRFILNLGTCIDYSANLLKNKYPNAELFVCDISEKKLHSLKCDPQINKSCSDFEGLPFANNTFDLIFSNFTLEWVEDLKIFFIELKRLLKPNGLSLFSTCGLDCFNELRNCIEIMPDEVNTSLEQLFTLRDMHNIGDELRRSHFMDPVMYTEWITLNYKAVDVILKDLESLGYYKDLDNFKEQFKLTYEQYRDINGLLPVTYEIIYGQAWKQNGNNSDQDLMDQFQNEDIYDLKFENR